MWTTEQCRVYLGLKTIRSTSTTLGRMGAEAVSREPGRSGMDLYDAGEIRRLHASRPRAGARTDLKGEGS